MQNQRLSARVSCTFLASAIFLSWSALTPAFAGSGGYLQGNVNKDDALNNQNAPGLKRDDMLPAHIDKAFTGDDPPGEPNFRVKQEVLPSPPPREPFSLNANDQGDGFDPQLQPGTGIPDQLAMRPQQASPQVNQVPQNTLRPQEAEPDLQLQWDIWHARVAQTIYSRYTMLTRFAGYGRNYRRIQCNVNYVVTCQGQIINAQILTTSGDPRYDNLCLQAIMSLSGDYATLQFPQGSRRLYMEKSANFGENLGHNGFTKTLGDKETIRGGGR